MELETSVLADLVTLVIDVMHNLLLIAEMKIVELTVVATMKIDAFVMLDSQATTVTTLHLEIAS
jgi:hypothetical protein